MKLFDIIERKTLFEVVNRIILVATLAGLEKLCVPFKRAIPYNQWLEYLYPYQEDTVSEFLLMLFVLSLLVMMILIAIMQIMITGIRGNKTRPNPVTSSKNFLYRFLVFSGKIRPMNDLEAIEMFFSMISGHDGVVESLQT